MIGFTRWLGVGAVIGVLGLVANALLLAARSRIKEGAILQTVGYSPMAIGMLVVFEGLILGLGGGLIGSVGALSFLTMNRFSFGSEGLILSLSPSYTVTVTGIAIAVLLALVSSIWPALEAARRPIVQSLRNS